MRLSKRCTEVMIGSKKAAEIWKEDGEIVPRILVDEMKKSKQKPIRILRYLPRVEKELLRLSICREQILLGAVPMSHLFTLPRIDEEKLPVVDKEANPNEHSVDWQAKYAEWSCDSNRKAGIRMLPTLPTIREQASPSLVKKEI